MEARYLLGAVLCLLFAFHTATAVEWDYEFGNKNVGQLIYDHSGEILPFSYRNFINIPVPPHMRISYVKVTVNSISPPKVDFNKDTNTVSIIYSVFQITLSSYQIKANAVKVIGD